MMQAKILLPFLFMLLIFPTLYAHEVPANSNPVKEASDGDSQQSKKSLHTASAPAQKEDVILRAMQDELARSMAKLRIEDSEKPYYLEYTVLDNRTWNMRAIFGAVTGVGSRMSPGRYLKVAVRVGDYKLDNSEFTGRANIYRALLGHTSGLVSENDYHALRRDIWLTTDRAYKYSLEQMGEKSAYLENQVRENDLPDFSKEKKLNLYLPRLQLNIDVAKWKGIIKRLSAVFRQYPRLQKSGVDMQVKEKYTYYINSEGTTVRYPGSQVLFVAYSSTRAHDGMLLKHHVPVFSTTVETMPTEKQLTAAVHKMAKELTALTGAPILDEYIGPVL
ncbi:MAG: hypothetical protein GY765_29785, partial [bacterium]|nr:hypothetical protein [bacterium]